MNAHEPTYRDGPCNGSHRRAVGFLALLAALAAATPRTALAWTDRGHILITEEAVRRLPEPLLGLLAAKTHLDRLRRACVAPGNRARQDSEHDRPQETPRHVFRIDAITDEAYPFEHFPRKRAEAETRFGAETFKENGAAPWAAAAALDRLADALAAGHTEEAFAAAGDLAHYAADLHMPLHTTRNHDGQLTGNHGIYKALEVGLVHRYPEFYEKELRKGRRVVRYLDAPTDRLFDWLITAHGRVKPILEADSVARRKTTYNPAQHPEDLDNPDSTRARAYYKTLKDELARRGSPEAAARRDAAAHLADLYYTAWVRAGKPLSLQAATPAKKETPTAPYWLLAPAIALVILLLWPRRQRGASGGSDNAPPGPQ